MFTSGLHCEFVPLSDMVRTTAPLTYDCPRTKRRWVVPAGFVSDCASIPRLLWGVIGNPFDSRWRRQSVLHDYLYAEQPVPRKAADLMFRDALLSGGLRPAKAWVMYIGVRIGGWLAWSRKGKPA